jgi:hypothetical protein
MLVTKPLCCQLNLYAGGERDAAAAAQKDACSAGMHAAN